MILGKYVFGILFTMLICSSARAYEFKLLSEIPVTGKKAAVAVNPVTDLAISLSETDGTLSIVDMVTAAVIHKVSLPSTPTGIAVHKGMNKALVASRDGTLYLCDLTSGELSRIASLDTPIFTVTVDESANSAMVGVAGGLRVIGLPGGEILSSVTIPGRIERLSMENSFAIAVSRDESVSKLNLLDLAHGSVTKTITLTGDAVSVALDTELGLILVTQRDKAGLLLFDAATLQLLATVETGKRVEIVAVNPSTHVAVLSDTLDGSLSIVGLEQRRVIDTIPLFKQAGPVCVDTARNRALVAHDEGLTIVQLENPAPRVSGLTPKEGAAEGDNLTLAITGDRFIKDSQTVFNGETPATRFESNEQLKATIPPEMLTCPGNVELTVSNPPPGGGASGSLSFKVLTPAPLLTTLTPDTVAIGSPTFTVRVEGKSFLPTATVNLNGKGIASRYISSTVLEAFVDASFAATKGTFSLTVTNSGITSFTSNALYLSILTTEELARKTSAMVAPVGSPGNGSLWGRVLNTEMQPLKGVSIRYKGLVVLTDDGGNFLLENIPAGRRTILVDGSTTVETNRHYPTIPITADIAAGSRNPMPFTPYLHRQKSYNFVGINPAAETILTDPEVPGFEMRIPAGVNIIGWDGKVNLKVSVRTVPVNRLPVKPVPQNSHIRTVYMFYFNKVGGGRPDRPIPIKSPNDLGLLPGEKAVLWYYDESPNDGEAPNDWAIAGTGTVSADGRYIVTDPGVGIPKFCCGATAWGGTGVSLPTSCKEGCGGKAGDPVDVTTGYFIHEQTDFVIPGIIPVEIKRIYRSRDGGSAVSGTTTGLGAFGKGMSFEYDWWIGTYNSMLLLTKPGSYQYDFALQGDGSYLNSVDPEFRGAKVTINADSTKALRMRDGRTYLFNTYGELVRIADRNGNQLTIARVHGYPDEGGHISSITTAEGRVLTFSSTYTGYFHRNDSITLPDGRAIGYTYEADPFNPYPRLKQVNYPDGGSIQYGYDSQGRMSSITNQRGVVEVTNVYDTSHRVTSQTHPDGGVYAFDYSVAGQTRMTAPNGAQTTWSYNGYGYLTQKITPDGTTTYTKAAGTNLLTSVTDPLNRTTSYTYYATSDAKNGLVQSVTDPLLNITSYDYETTYGLPTKITDALGKITTITYTPAGAPPTQAVIKDPLLNQTTVNYNAYGLPASITDPNNNTTTLAYDPVNHTELATITDALGNSLSYTYDTFGRLGSISDANGAKTTYGYDPMNRVSSITDPLDGVTRYYYNLSGNLAMVIDAKENSIQYEYDDRDRITKMTDQLLRYETYSYYRNAEITATTGDNLKSYTDRKGQTTTFNEYDGQNRPKKATFGDASYLQYSYDAVGRATNIFDSLTGAVVYTYNDYGCTSCGGRGLDLISQETTPLSTLNYTYDQDGRRASMTVAGEPVVNYHYDTAGRLTSLDRKIGSKSRTYTLAYDNGDRRTSLKIPVSTNNKYVTSTYGYDIANHITSLLQQGASAQIENLTYTYYPNGNRKSSTRTAAQTLSPAITGTNNDAANEMLAYNSKNLVYDANGNLQTKTDASGTTTYTWDSRNRLTVISGPSLAANFSYDAVNRRISKTINGTTTQFVYDGWDVIQEIKSGVKTNYIRTLNIDEPLTRTNSTTMRHYVMDTLGSIVALADDTGAIKTTYVYDAFGNVTTTGEASDNPFQYTGRENDGTGLYYYRARYYSPEMQRFIQEDPIRLSGGINYFSYVQNNPINWTDPKGLEIRVYSSNAFGISGLNHAFVYSTETGRGKGTNGSSGVTRGNGVGELQSPYSIAYLPPGMSENEFMDKIEAARGWNNWIWTPWVNDCHSDLENAFNQANVSYPGAPNGRLNIDDQIRSRVYYFMYQMIRSLNPFAY